MPKRDRAAYMREYRAERSPKRKKERPADRLIAGLSDAVAHARGEPSGVRTVIGFDPITGAPIYREETK